MGGYFCALGGLVTDCIVVRVMVGVCYPSKSIAWRRVADTLVKEAEDSPHLLFIPHPPRGMMLLANAVRNAAPASLPAAAGSIVCDACCAEVQWREC